MEGQSGSTPLVLDDLPVGSRAIRLEADRYEGWSASTRIVAVSRRAYRRPWTAPSGNLRFARLLRDSMPRVPASAAVTPRHNCLAAQHLLHGHVMIRPALGTPMRDACLFRLARRQRIGGFHF